MRATSPSLPYPSLCLVTDRRQTGDRPLGEIVALALRGGVNMVQLREKDLPSGKLMETALALRLLTKGRALLFINDRVDVAIASGADGVQLGEEAMTVSAARKAGAGLLVSRSVHDVEGAARAQKDGADLLVAGTIFPSGSHPAARPAGVELLERLRAEVSVPYIAIGGVNERNAPHAIAAGAAGVAVIGAITRSDDPQRAARGLMSSIADAARRTGR